MESPGNLVPPKTSMEHREPGQPQGSVLRYSDRRSSLSQLLQYPAITAVKKKLLYKQLGKAWGMIECTIVCSYTDTMLLLFCFVFFSIVLSPKHFTITITITILLLPQALQQNLEVLHNIFTTFKLKGDTIFFCFRVNY